MRKHLPPSAVGLIDEIVPSNHPQEGKNFRKYAPTLDEFKVATPS